MRRHFSRAEYRAAGDIYDAAVEEGAATTYEDDLLRARVHLKQDATKAVAFLIRRPPRPNASEKSRAEWAMLLGIGYAHMRDFELADHNFSLARRLFKSPADKAKLASHVARRWILGDNADEAWGFAAEMLSDRSLGTKIRNEVLRSSVFCHERRYREAAQALINAINLIGSRRDRHLEPWLRAVHILALLSAEISFDEAAGLARSELDQPVEWPSDFQAQRFQALNAVGWARCLRGDMLGCFRYLRAAERVVSSEAFEVILLLDRAYFARMVGEENWALNEIAKAEALAERIDWHACRGEERVALLLLVRATTAIDAQRARYYFARYKALERLRSPVQVSVLDEPMKGRAVYAEAMVKLATGDPSGAEDDLRQAWAIFDRIGCDWRAAFVAKRLWEQTKKERWRQLAELKLEAFPHSWLAREIKAGGGASFSGDVKLPPMKDKVLELLCAKTTTAEMALALGVSPHTVRNHLKAIFRTFGVNSRAALVAKVVRPTGDDGNGTLLELSPMQGEVARLVCEGLSPKAIAEKLGLSRHTVLNHLKVAYKKLGVNSREALVVEAIKRGMLP